MDAAGRTVSDTRRPWSVSLRARLIVLNSLSSDSSPESLGRAKASRTLTDMSVSGPCRGHAPAIVKAFGPSRRLVCLDLAFRLHQPERPEQVAFGDLAGAGLLRVGDRQRGNRR